jgi:hypothetical protein
VDVVGAGSVQRERVEKDIVCVEAACFGSHWSYWVIHVYVGRGHKAVAIPVFGRVGSQRLETRR